MRGSDGAISTGALVVVALVIAAVVGLIAGGVWGQTGRHAASPSTEPSTSTTTPAPSPTDTTPTPTSVTSSPTPSVATPTTGPGPTPTGTAPSAPATTTTVVDGWRLGAWKITNVGSLGVDTTARNTGTATSSANLVLYVYINGQLIATTTATVTGVPAGGSVPVHFSGSDPWKPGQKVLLLVLA